MSRSALFWWSLSLLIGLGCSEYGFSDKRPDNPQGEPDSALPTPELSDSGVAEPDLGGEGAGDAGTTTPDGGGSEGGTTDGGGSEGGTTDGGGSEGGTTDGGGSEGGTTDGGGSEGGTTDGGTTDGGTTDGGTTDGGTTDGGTTGGSGLDTGDPAPEPDDADFCLYAASTSGYLDLFQTAGDGKVVFCHWAGSSFVVIDTSISACIPHLGHTSDVLPSTLCDS